MDGSGQGVPESWVWAVEEGLGGSDDRNVGGQTYRNIHIGLFCQKCYHSQSKSQDKPDNKDIKHHFLTV